VASVPTRTEYADLDLDLDLDRMVARIHGWETRFTQVGPGRGLGSVSEAALPTVRAVCLRVDTEVALEALPVAQHPDALLHFGIGCFEPKPLLWQGCSVRPDMLLLDEGGDLSTFALPAGCELLVARLDRERAERLARALHGAEYRPASRRAQLYPQPPERLAELRALLRTLAEGALGVEEERIRSASEDLYERVALLLSAPATRDRSSPRTRRRALGRAVEYMRTHARERIALSDLCLAAECSERSLRQAFREHYGTNPIAFLKRLRLQGLRRDLRDAAPGSTTVLDLALRWGFWHLGHLGREYKALFGETPGQTLAGS
jgi:AraC family ethanolamine operon transcriptional activator